MYTQIAHSLSAGIHPNQPLHYYTIRIAGPHEHTIQIRCMVDGWRWTYVVRPGHLAHADRGFPSRTDALDDAANHLAANAHTP